MKVSLVVMSVGKAAGQSIPITLPQFLIGRDPQCNLRPASALISKRHCAVITKSAKVVVRDFGSTNGTFVNDEPVKGERPLENNDVLKVGPLSFRVAIEATTPVNKPTPVPVPAAKGSEGVDDESVAAMLLSIQDEGGTTTVNPAESDLEVPAGSTVMDTPPVPLGEEGKKPEDAAKSKEKKNDPKNQQNSSAAAKMILEKYTRRQRS
jgi:pSer/pThr/pTyr-binding forkhead associated (FHA) protein